MKELSAVFAYQTCLGIIDKEESNQNSIIIKHLSNILDCSVSQFSFKKINILNYLNFDEKILEKRIFNICNKNLILYTAIRDDLNNLYFIDINSGLDIYSSNEVLKSLKMKYGFNNVRRNLLPFYRIINQYTIMENKYHTVSKELLSSKPVISFYDMKDIELYLNNTNIKSYEFKDFIINYETVENKLFII